MKKNAFLYPALLFTPLLWSCASGGSVGPARPSTDLSRSDYIVWHSLKRVLSSGEVQGSDVGAVCMGLGEAGEDPPSPQLVRDFASTDPPVVPSTACQRTPEGVTFAGASAILLSFYDVDDVQGRPSVRVKVEVPGGETSSRRCSLTERLRFQVVRRDPGRMPDPTSASEMAPPPPSVICQD